MQTDQMSKADRLRVAEAEVAQHPRDTSWLCQYHLKPFLLLLTFCFLSHMQCHTGITPGMPRGPYGVLEIEPGSVLSWLHARHMHYHCAILLQPPQTPLLSSFGRKQIEQELWSPVALEPSLPTD